MTWRNRNLFRKKAVPVQKFNMGGSVRGVEALKNVAPTLSTFDYDNAVNMMGGGMVDMPVPQMKMGGDPAIELFESGDSALNEALNTQAAVDTMNQALMTGGGDAVPQSTMAAPMAEEEAPVTKDQGFTNSAEKDFTDVALQEAKDISQDIIMKAMAEIEKDIDTAEEVSIPEIKKLAQLIISQQNRLQESAVELSKAMDLPKVEDVTLFDNEFEAEVQKNYPMVAAVLERELPNFVGTMPVTDSEIDKIYGAGAAEEAMGEALMPMTDSQIDKRYGAGAAEEAMGEALGMQEGGDPVIEQMIRDKEQQIAQKQQEITSISSQGGQGQEARDKKIDVLKKDIEILQKEIASLRGFGGTTTPSTTGDEALQDYVENTRLGGQTTERPTFADVMKDPEVKKLFADYESYITKSGLGNIKSRKVGGTSDLIGVRRDIIGGEAKAEKDLLEEKSRLLREIEGDPYGYKQSKLTNTELNIKSGNNIATDAAFDRFVASGLGSAVNFMLKSGAVPQVIRQLAGITDQTDKKTILGTEMSFPTLVQRTYDDKLIKSALAESIYLEILSDVWRGRIKADTRKEIMDIVKRRLETAGLEVTE